MKDAFKSLRIEPWAQVQGINWLNQIRMHMFRTL